MEVDPKITFWIGVATTVCLAVGTGAVSFTNAISADWVPAIVAWNKILGFVGNSVMTALIGFSGAQHGPITKMLRGERQ